MKIEHLKGELKARSIIKPVTDATGLRKELIMPNDDERAFNIFFL